MSRFGTVQWQPISTATGWSITGGTLKTGDDATQFRYDPATGQVWLRGEIATTSTSVTLTMPKYLTADVRQHGFAPMNTSLPGWYFCVWDVWTDGRLFLVDGSTTVQSGYVIYLGNVVSWFAKGGV